MRFYNIVFSKNLSNFIMKKLIFYLFSIIIIPSNQLFEINLFGYLEILIKQD